MLLTDNIADSAEYENYQKQFDYIFEDAYFIHAYSNELSEKYTLNICHYNHSYLTGEKSGYSVSCQELVLLNQAGAAIFKYRNNFGQAFYFYLKHTNTNEYFICGNDLGQYTVYNITHNKEWPYVSQCLFEPEKRTSHFWYVKELLYNPNSDLVALNGQDTMNCPTVTVVDFAFPDVVPLKGRNLSSYLDRQYEEGSFCSAIAWTENNSLQLQIGEEVTETVILSQSQIREMLEM